MAADPNESFLTRPPKLRPGVAFALGILCVALGLALKGSIGGGLVGGGIASILMAGWDAFRLNFFAKPRPPEDSVR